MSRQYISTFRPKPSMMPRMANANRVSCIGRPRTPSFLKDYKKSNEPKFSRNKSETKKADYIDSPAAKLAVRRNAMQVQMLESALAALRGKERKALRELENEMRRYRKDLENIPVRSLTSNLGTNLEKLLPPIENEDVVLKRFGKIKSTFKMKLKKKPCKQQNKTALVKETEFKIEESEVEEPVIISSSQPPTPRPAVTFSRPQSSIPSPPLRIVTTRMSSSRSYSSSRHKHNVETEKNIVKTERTQDSILRSSTRQSREHDTSSTERNNPTKAIASTKEQLSKLIDYKDQQHQADLPQRITIPTCQSFSNELSKPSSLHKPVIVQQPEQSLSENIAKTCGEYLGLLKLISQQQMTPEQANKSTSLPSCERAASDQSSVALVPVSGSNKALSSRRVFRTLRCRDAATQFEDKYVVEEAPSPSTPKEMWPSWFSPNSKPVQTDSTYSPDESTKKRTKDTGMNTSYTRKNTQEPYEHEMYANTKLTSQHSAGKLRHTGTDQMQPKQTDDHYKSQCCAKCSSFPETSFVSTLSSYDSALSGFNNPTPSGRRNNQIFITSTDESIEDSCSCYYRNSHRPKSRYMEKNHNCCGRTHCEQRKKPVLHPIRGNLRIGSTSADKTLCNNCSKISYTNKHEHIKNSQNRRGQSNDTLRLSSVSSSNSRYRSRHSNQSSSADLTGCHICQQSGIMSTQTPAQWKQEPVQMLPGETSPVKCINRSAQVSFLRHSIAETQTDRDSVTKNDIGVGTNPSPQLIKSTALSPATTSAETTLLEFTSKTPVECRQESPRLNNPIMSELEKHSMVGITQTEENFDVDNSIRMPSVWRPVYHIPNCKPKSARLVPILQPGSNNPVFHVELCAISEEKSTSHSLTPQKNSGTSSNTTDKQPIHKFTLTQPFGVEVTPELPQDGGCTTEIDKKEISPVEQHKPFRPMSRIESDVMADNVFSRETNFGKKYVSHHGRKYVPAQVIEAQPNEAQDLQQPVVDNDIPPTCAMIRGEECSDFVDCTSLRSADFATRWRRGIRRQCKKTPSSPVRTVWKKASPDDTNRRQTYIREFSGSAKKTSQAYKRHLSSPKISRKSEEFASEFYDSEESNLQKNTFSDKNMKERVLSQSYPPVKVRDNSVSLKEEPKSDGLQKQSITYKVSRRKPEREKENENSVTPKTVEKDFLNENPLKNLAPEDDACNDMISSLGDFNIGSTTHDTDLRKIKAPKPEPLWKRSKEAKDGPTSYKNLIKLQKFSSPSEPITDGNTDSPSGKRLSPASGDNTLVKQKDADKALEIEKIAQLQLQEKIKQFLNDEACVKKDEENVHGLIDTSESDEDVEQTQAVPCEIHEISNKDMMAPRARKRLMMRK